MLQNMEFIQDFVEEAKGHTESIEAGLLGMDSRNIDEETVNDIFRAIHSIKGTASFFGLGKIVELSHAMENVFGECRAGRLRITGELTDIMLSCNDCLKEMIIDVLNSENTDIAPYLHMLSGIWSSGNSADSKIENKNDGMLAEGLNLPIPEAKRGLVFDSIQRGHRLYILKQWLFGDLIGKELNPAALIGEIKSFGNLIDCRFEIDNQEAVNNDLCIAILFTTVLEKDLVTDSLQIDPACLVEVEAPGNILENRESNGKVRTKNNDVQTNAAAQEDDQKELTQKKSGIVADDSIRVHVNLLDNLLNLASEMVLGRNQLLRAMENHRKNIIGIDPILQNIDRITTDIQEKIMQTRMQPIANVFNKFPRIIRDLSKKLGKDIELRLEGKEVELDKSIIEALGDPLIHLVRNAADHGLETRSEREAAGKSRVGSIVLSAYHEGGYVNIDITDDGKGIDTEKILSTAVSKGLITQSDTAQMLDQEIYQLLFRPGFSTAEKVTDVSGRGVGLDVVKTNIEKLGGTIEIFSWPNKGTTVRLLLPLTIAIISSLIVEAENQKFALPQVNLQEIVRIKANDPTKRIEYINNAEVIRLRGKLLPIIHLADILGMTRTYTDPITGEIKPERRKTLFDSRRFGEDNIPDNRTVLVSERRKSTDNTVRVLVIKVGSRRIGIAVDSIYGSEEILVKPLPVHIKDCKCYSGVTILGDGKAAMILDPGGIIKKANFRFHDESEDKKERDINGEGFGIREQQSLLIFKCSGPEILTVDLSMVSRVEEINRDIIEKIGNKEYINYRKSSLRVIRPEDFLPLNKNKSKAEKLYVIVPKHISHPMGILVEEIHDTMQTEIKTVQEDIKAKGFIGSTILDGRIVILINLYELFELADPEHYNVKTGHKKGKKISVLLVEDSPFFEKLEENYLAAAGYEVVTARNGREALKVLDERKIDIVLSDINMPVMDGMELVRRIRSSKELSHLPVIAVTSLTGESQKKAGLEAGFDYYEFKLDKTRMLETVEKALQKRRDT